MPERVRNEDGVASAISSRQTMPSALPNRLLGGLALALIAAACLLASLPVWRSDALTLDEHASYWIAAEENPGTLLQRSLEYSATPPLSFALQRAALDLLGKHAWALRLPSLLALWAAPLFVFLAARSTFGWRAAMLAPLLMAWHPDLWEPGRLARTYGVTLGLSSAVLYATARWMQAPTSWRWLLVWTGLQAALLWNHYVNVAFVAAVSGLLAVRWFSKSAPPLVRGRLLVAGLLLLVFGAPLIPAFVRVWELRPFLEFIRTSIPIERQIGAFALCFALPAILCAFVFRSRKPADVPSLEPAALPGWMGLLLVVGPGLQLLFVALSFLLSPTLGHPRYALAGAPATVLVVAALLARAANGIAIPLAAAGMVAGWVFVGQPIWVSPVIDSAEAADWKVVGGVVQAEGVEGETIFVYGGLVEAGLIPTFGHDLLFEEYIASRVGRFFVTTPHPRYGLPLLWTQLEHCRPIYDAVIDDAGERGKSIWIACATDIDLGRDAGEAMRVLLQRQGWRVTLSRDLSTARVQRLSPPEQ